MTALGRVPSAALGLLPTILLALCAAGQTTPSQSARIGAVRLEQRGLTPAPFAVEAQPAAECEDQTARVARIEGNRAVFDASPCSRWRLGCRGDGVFCPEIAWPAEDASTDLPPTLEVYSAADLTVRLRSPGSHGPPDAVRIQGFAHHSDDHSSAFLVGAAVDDGEVHAQVPASLLDLRIAAAGFAPSYHWSLSTRSGSARIEADLRPGGSIAGFVVSAGSKEPIVGAEVRVLPRGFDLMSPEAIGRFSALTGSTVKTDERGFFQLPGLHPEVFTVHARAEGFSSATIEAVEIHEDAESRLASPLVLAPVVIFAVTIDPPTFPPDQQWMVELLGRTTPGIRRDRFEEMADEAGVAEFSSLPPGEYDLVLRAGEDRSRQYAERLSITGHDAVRIELPLIEVKGRVTLGDEPVAASLELSTGNRDDWAFETDDEGEFAGVMRVPDQRSMMAKVTAQEGSIETQVLLAEGSGLRIDRGILEIEIEIPDGSMTGTVVDLSGRPVEGAEVSAGRNPLRLGKTITDGSGEFSLRGLPHEILEVVAGHPLHGSAGPLVVDLSSGLDPAPVRLVLETSVTISGRLRWADENPVRAVAIHALALGRGLKTDTAQTLLDGSFEISAPPDADRVLLKVLSRETLVWSQCVPIFDGKIDVTLPFSLANGRLELELRSDPENPLPPSGGAWSLISRAGGLLEPGDFGPVWDRFDRDPEGRWTRIAVNGVAPGTYAAVWLPLRLEERIRLVCTNQVSDAWDWRPLDPGGTVSFVLDSN